GSQAKTLGVDAEAKAHSKMLDDESASSGPTSTPGFTSGTASGHADSPALESAGTSTPAAVAPVSSSDLPNSADPQLLSNAGATHASDSVPDQIEQDNANGVAPKSDKYLFGAKKDGDTVVDAPKEKDRIQKDKADDKPLTTGDTPVIAPKDRGI